MRVSILTLILVAGCSLINKPDQGNIPPLGLDGGLDGSPDIVSGDAGPDAPPPDAFDAGPLVEDCTEPGDEDTDGLINCADFDCAGHPSCCTDGETNQISFSGAPAWTSIGSPTVTDFGGDVLTFPGTEPSIYVNNTCFAMAQGAVFNFSLQLAEGIGSDCSTNGERCSDYAAFFVSSVTEALPGERIVAEMAVALYGSGRAELYRGRGVSALDMMNVPLPNAPIPVSVRFSPALVGGESVMRTEVTIGGTTFEVQPTFDQGDLDRDCSSGIAGLHFGFEGAGSFVQVVEQNARGGTLECTNPTQFDSSGPLLALASAPQDDASRVSLGWTGNWTAGDVTHPELVLERRDGDPDVWHVFGSTGSEQLNLSFLPNFQWSIGHSSTEVWNSGMPWFNDADGDLLHELEGLQPSVAMDAGAPVMIRVFEDDLSYCVPGSVCVPLGIRGCSDVANPSLVRTPRGNFLLFYQCTLGDHAVVMSQALPNRIVGEREEPVQVLSSQDFAGLARNTIVDFDVLLDERPMVAGEPFKLEYLVRAWFVGEALGNVRSLLLATGSIGLSAVQGDAGIEFSADAELADLQQGFTLRSFAGNPIATEAELFRGGGQSLHGVSVEKLDSPRDLLFLLGRRSEDPEGRIYDFVPVEQTWGQL